MGSWSSWLTALPLIAACGSAGGGPADAGPGDAAGDAAPDAGSESEVALPEAPTEPAPPDFSTCPEGWRAVTDDDGIAVCESTLEMHDVRISDTQPVVSDLYGRGIEVGIGALLTARRVIVEGSHESGIFLVGDDPALGLPRGRVDAEDLIVRGTLPQATDGAFGRGVSVQDDGSFRAARVLIEDNHDVALIANGLGATLDVEDLVLRGTRPAADERFGRGVNVQDGATAVLRRVVSEDNRETGVFTIGEGTTFEIEDLRVTGTRPNGLGEYGRGVVAERGSTLSVIRAVVSDNVDIGVAAFGLDTAVTLAHLEVRSTHAHEDLGGTGLGAYREARLSAEGFLIADSDLCGVQLARGGSVDLRSGVVAGNVIGACVQVPGYDLDRLSREVVYRDNVTALDSPSLPIPDGAGGLDSTP